MQSTSDLSAVDRNVPERTPRIAPTPRDTATQTPGKPDANPQHFSPDPSCGADRYRLVTPFHLPPLR
ncbi:MAG: hypothetical protein KDC87_22285 [Planctomycetes bacterium]|nr:hypothetical protein [Planctomycetota bacterium]MCB9872081.1 hypothetical protein [Planctomycetota bacterium]